MKEPFRFRRHRIARAVRPENRADPAKVRAVTPGSLYRARRDAGPHFAEPISVPLSAHATPAIAASTTASAPTPCLFMATA